MPDITFMRPSGELANGYLAEPSDSARGGVVVIHEWWGLTDQIRRFCDRLASEGYHVLAPDLYDGETAKTAEEANAKLNALNFPRAVNEYVRGAAIRLKKMGGRVAVLGFCAGGAMTLASSAMLEELAAGVCYYGIPPGFEPANVRVPLLLHFAQHDDWCTPDNVDKLEAGLKRANKSYELHRYDAHHAFANDKRPEVFNAAATEQAFTRTIAFLRKQLG